MYADRVRIDVTTGSGGDGEAFSPNLRGRVVNIIYQKAESGEDTGLVFWDEDDVNASKTVSPHQAAHNQQGEPLLLEDGGEPVPAPLFLAGERLKISVANGGNGTSGTFIVVIA